MNVVLKDDLQGVDWEALAEVYRHAFHGPMSGERIERIFRRCYSTRIAVLDGVEVGGVYAVSDGDFDAAIYGLAVRTDCQRRGIGTLLMRSIVESLPASAAIVLMADEPHLVAFYRSLGFRRLKIAMAMRYPESAME